MNIIKHKINITYLIFLCIAVFYAVGNIIWWRLNTPIIPNDIAALHFLDIFKEEWLFYNAPLLTWIMRLMFYTFGKETFDLYVIVVNYLFFLIPLYFIYKIGMELQDKKTGNMAMILFSLVPAVYGMSRQYGHQDYHIIAAITFNIYCLIKTDYFKNRKWSLLYGISVGLGLLIKDVFLAYFFVPWLYIALQSLIQKKEKIKIINIFFTVFVGSLISCCHYFRYGIIMKMIYEPITESVPVFQFETFRIMIISLWEILLSPPIFLFFILGLIWFIFKYKGEYRMLLLFWIFVPWLIITFMKHFKVPEYQVGFIPAIVLIISLYLSDNKKLLYKKIIAFFLIFICVIQYIFFSYNIIDLSKIKFNIKNQQFNYYDNRYEGVLGYDYKKIKNFTKFVSYLKKTYNNNKIIIYNYDSCFFFGELELFSKMNNLNVKIIRNDLIDAELDKRLFDNVRVIVFLGRKFAIKDKMQIIKEHFEKYPTFKLYFSFNEKDIERYLEFSQSIINNNFSSVKVMHIYNIIEDAYRIEILEKF